MLVHDLIMRKAKKEVKGDNRVQFSRKAESTFLMACGKLPTKYGRITRSKYTARQSPEQNRSKLQDICVISRRFSLSQKALTLAKHLDRTVLAYSPLIGVPRCLCHLRNPLNGAACNLNKGTSRDTYSLPLYNI